MPQHTPQEQAKNLIQQQVLRRTDPRRRRPEEGPGPRPQGPADRPTPTRPPEIVRGTPRELPAPGGLDTTGRLDPSPLPGPDVGPLPQEFPAPEEPTPVPGTDVGPLPQQIAGADIRSDGLGPEALVAPGSQDVEVENSGQEVFMALQNNPALVQSLRQMPPESRAQALQNLLLNRMRVRQLSRLQVA